MFHRLLCLRTSLVGFAVLLSACGGGDGNTHPVTEISASSLAYGKTAVFTLSGNNLDANLSVTLNKCTGLTIAAGGTTMEKSVTCIVSGTGDITFDVKDASGTVLLSRRFTVPEPQVTLQTNLGTVVLELNPTLAPVTVNNFLAYVNSGYYTGTLFHRVVPDFVIQGGGFTAGLIAKTPIYTPIKLESNNGLSNLRGTVGMARKSTPDSATSQFFVNLVDNAGLNYASATSPGYAVFGKVVQGMAVIDAMAAVPTTSADIVSNVPQTDIVIQTAQQTQ